MINSSGYIFAGTNGGGVFRSMNNGENWTEVNNGLANKNVYALAINPNGDIFAATWGGGVFRSSDNGESWILPSEHPKYIQCLAINADGHIFGGYGFYKSTDNGESWTEITSGLTNYDIVTLLIDSEGYIFGGTRGSGVFRSVETTLTAKKVIIDVKPGSFPNSINPKSKGLIPVAILTTNSFNSVTVDTKTVRFGRTGTEASPVNYAFEDVDGDGDVDLVLHFKTQETGIQCGDTSAYLTGKILSGQKIKGVDSIETVGCK